MSAPPRLLSSVDGRIVEFLVCLPAPRIEDGDPALVRALLHDLLPSARLVAVTHRRTEGAARRMAADRPGSSTVLSCPDGIALTPWCRDALLVRDRPVASLAPSARAFPATPARNLAECLFAAGFAGVEQDGVAARGGNLLAIDDRVLVGADEWRRWDTETGTDAIRYFGERIDATRRPLVLGGGSGRTPGPPRLVAGPDRTAWRATREPAVVERRSGQAAYHLDLYVAPACVGSDGHRTIVVGDPRTGAMLGGEPVAEDRCREFDAVAAELDLAGFHVVRTPLPLVGFDDPRARRRELNFASYENALVEDGGAGRRRVHLPRYGRIGRNDLTAADDAAAALWRALGFEAVPIEGLSSLVAAGGGLHCAVLDLSRAALDSVAGT